MSKGTRIIGVRLPDALRFQMEDFIQRNRDRDRNGDLTITKFIVDCVKERLHKFQRAKKSATARKQAKQQGVKHPQQERAGDSDEGL